MSDFFELFFTKYSPLKLSRWVQGFESPWGRQTKASSESAGLRNFYT